MSLGNLHYTLGTCALGLGGLDNYPYQGYMCICPCHQSVWLSTSTCCSCRKNQTITIITDNAMTTEVKLMNEIIVLRETIKRLEERIDRIDAWKKGAKILCDQSKKPHTCPTCEGYGGTKISGTIDEICHSCEGKGIVWG